LIASLLVMLNAPARADTELLAYFPFDGSPDEAARNLPTLTNPRGESPATIAGRYGDAFNFDGGVAIAAPLDIDFDTHPQLSVSAWVMIRPDRTESGGLILSPGTGATGAPKLGLVNEDIRAHGGRNRPRHDHELETDVWTHVAAAYDFDRQTIEIHVAGEKEVFTDLDMYPVDLAANDRSQQAIEHPHDPEQPERRYIVVGALTVDLTGALQGVAVDDLRVYSGLLTDAEVDDLRESQTPAPLGKTAPPYEPPEPEEPEEPEEPAGNEDSDEEPDDPGGTESATGTGHDDAGADDDDRPTGTLVGLRLSDTYDVSGLTGDTAEQAETVDLVTSPVTALRTGEKGGGKYMPCEVSLRSDGGYFDPEELHYNGCSRGRQFTRTFGSYYSVRLLTTAFNEDYALNALAICQNKRRNDRLKGLRAEAIRLEIDWDDNEFEFRNTDTREVTNNNCREWSGKATCPGEDQVASGVRVHFNERANGTASITGMELICRTVEPVYE